MAKIIPLNPEEKKISYSEKLREDGLEEITWKSGKFIKIANISMENCPSARAEARGNSFAASGLGLQLTDELFLIL